MAKKNTRSDRPTSDTTQPVPERRRTVRAPARSAATSPAGVVAEPDGSPPVARDTANEMTTEGNGNATPAPTYEQIAEAAYHRYLERGGQDGYDFDDWLDAERSLRSPRPKA